MRLILLALVLACGCFAQSPPETTITVTDENGVAVPSARIFLQTSSSQVPAQEGIRCQTDFAGRCRFPNLSAGTYEVRVEKEGFYALLEPQVQLAPGSALDVSISHQREVREVVNVQESPAAIDRSQVTSQERLSGLDVINIVYPGTHDFRNVLNFIPGVVQDQFGQPHVAGAQTYQTVTLLDGFNVTQPANGQLVVRVSTDAFRSIQVEPSRVPAEAGKGSGGLLLLNTGIGDDHFRFSATDFIPSIQNKRGWRFDQFLPHVTFSGPVIKGRIWFYDAFEGEYTNLIFTALPVGQDNDLILRLGNLSKLQTNLTSRNILTASFLVNTLHDKYAYLSPQNPQPANPRDVEFAYIASLKDQHYFKGGQLLETGFAFDEYDLRLTPYGVQPYQITPLTAFGNYYLQDETHANRWQALTNLYLPPRRWHGRHDFRVGFDVDRISYNAQFVRQPIWFLTAVPSAQPPDICSTNPSVCTRFSTFSPAPLHEQYNTEISAYAEDRWTVTDRLLVEPGIRFDRDNIVGDALISPRLAGTYVLDNSGNTKFSAGIGVIYDATPIFLIARPFAGTRQDTFFSTAGTCSPVCITGPRTTTFSVNTNELEAPRFLNWSVGVERKLPKAIYLKAEFLQRHGSRGFVYDAVSPGSTSFSLRNTRDDRYDAFQITVRHNFKQNYSIMGAYTRSRAHSSQALDFNVDSPVLSSQQPGPYSWDTPNRFLTWGYVPFFTLPVLHKFELAYSAEARTGFPFTELTTQQEVIGEVGALRYPFYFSLNVQLEKRFHLFHNDWAVRGGFDNITGRCDPFVVNPIIDPVSHPFPTFSGCLGRAFTSRIRLLGRK
jgi:hypothetical protein